MHVYHATLEIKYETPYDLGLYAKPEKAMAACDAFAAKTLWWGYSDEHRMTSEPFNGHADEFFMIARRPVVE